MVTMRLFKVLRETSLMAVGNCMSGPPPPPVSPPRLTRPPQAVHQPVGPGSTYTLTLCRPMMKEILLLQGLMKLDQLESSVMYSPFRARNRMGEESKGCPPACTTEKGSRRGAVGMQTCPGTHRKPGLL